MKELSDCKTPPLFIKKVRSETEDEAVIQVNSSEQAMVFLAMQYGEFVEVLEPENIRDVHILWGTVGDVDGDRDEVTVTLIATGIRECEKKIVEPDFVSIEKNRYKSPIEEMSIKVPAFLQKKIKNNL